LLKALVNHLILNHNEVVIMDMEAGIEHLGRGTSGSMDGLIIVVNPGKRSRVAAEKIKKLGSDIGIKDIYVLGNRIKSEQDKDLIQESMKDFKILGLIPEYDEIANADREGVRPFDDISTIPEEFKTIVNKLLSK
ncbi:MAG: carbon monoxide dehydrogenase, partial [Desulfobacteraceae bacterium]|nr:carbon monoxide dehydrogenase [Desulfobacteraceae bacterium]